ncbi:MAG: hypothetical protein IIZ33_08215 [Erysipelotrichaceae bacterium]|nr:hypothetical protein [Erysipelotrichaceae bacterium]
MYFFKRLFQIDVKRMFTTIKKIARRSHKPFLFIFLDVINCAFRYGAGYMDYFVFNFEELSAKQRETYITRTVNNNYFLKMNDRSYYHIFNDKTEFLEIYKEFIRRDHIDLRTCSEEDYEAFVKKHPVFMGKPVDGQCGYGIEIVDTHGRDLKEVKAELERKTQYLLEEKIVQNEELSRLYPCSINTIRVVTCYKNGECSILFTALRIGNNGKHVDNFNNGGMFSVIDEDGVIRKPAIDKEGVEYEIHPYTGTPIIGFKIPMFKEIIEQCKKMAAITPQVGLTGWDMCVTDKGIDVVEGNQLPGYDIYQSRCHLNKDRMGLKPRFDAAIYKD